MIAIVLGTRPEIIKMSPVIRECHIRHLDYFILHSGQHYSYHLDEVFFQELGLPVPKYNLDVGSGTHAEQTGKILIGVERVLLQERPSIVLVQGDTNTTLAGALAGAKLQIKVGHVEAGLRSYDWNMPEEINRVLADRLSDFLFVPTKRAMNILLGEGTPRESIFLTGNTVVDAVYQNLEISKNKARLLNELALREGEYFLVTTHRPENVDVRSRLKGILDGLHMVYREFLLPLVYSIHPRTKRRMEEYHMALPDGIKAVEPPGFLDFLQLEANAKVVLTDSGGIQEEACILKVPCVTLRDNTERPETLEVGSNILVGTNPQKILEAVVSSISKENNWQNPFGDGQAASRIVGLIGK